MFQFETFKCTRQCLVGTFVNCETTDVDTEKEQKRDGREFINKIS